MPVRPEPPWRASNNAPKKKPRLEEEEEKEEEADEDKRVLGRVVRFAAKRGFGFIKPVDGGGKEVFVHWAQISSTSKWPQLDRDMLVQYTPGFDEDGRNAAFNVTTENGENIDLEDEEERKLSSFRTTGIVKFFAKGGYGFITLDKTINFPEKLQAGTDIYVGREELEVAEEGLCRLEKGMQVEFNVFKAEGKDHVAAARVTEPGGSLILVEKGEGKGKGKGKGKFKGKRDRDFRDRDFRDRDYGYHDYHDYRDSKGSGKSFKGGQRPIGKDSRISTPYRPAVTSRPALSSGKGKEPPSRVSSSLPPPGKGKSSSKGKRSW